MRALHTGAFRRRPRLVPTASPSARTSAAGGVSAASSDGGFMKSIALSLVAAASLVATLAAKPTSVTGTYVEARTAEVFAGACIVNGEAAMGGREALLAWKVGHGQVDGVPL